MVAFLMLTMLNPIGVDPQWECQSWNTHEILSPLRHQSLADKINKLKALVNEDTLLRTHCCPWCFLGCANWETFAVDTDCFWTKSETFFVSRTQNLCPVHKICVPYTKCVRNKCYARGQTGKHLCRQQCVLVCQSLIGKVYNSKYGLKSWRYFAAKKWNELSNNIRIKVGISEIVSRMRSLHFGD